MQKYRVMTVGVSLLTIYTILKGLYEHQRGRPRQTIKSTNQEILFDTSSRIKNMAFVFFLRQNVNVNAQEAHSFFS